MGVVTDCRGSTNARRRLRLTLKKIRENRRLTIDQVRKDMEWSVSKLIRIENGTVSIAVNDLKVLLSYYEVDEESEVAGLLELARAARQRHWASEYRHLALPAFMDYLGYEDEARRISVFHPVFVPGLVQTEQYAEAIVAITASGEIASSELSGRVRLRLVRQQRILASGRDVEVRVAVDESALRRMVGGPTVMRGQLRHLRDLIDRPGIHITIVPTSIEAHLGLASPFSVLEFHSREDSDVVYLDNADNDVALVEYSARVEAYKNTFDHLLSRAISGRDAAARLDRLHDELA